MNFSDLQRRVKEDGTMDQGGTQFDQRVKDITGIGEQELRYHYAEGRSKLANYIRNINPPRAIDVILDKFEELDVPDINMPNFRYRQRSTFNIMKKIKKLGHYIRNDDKTITRGRGYQKFPDFSEDDFQTPINTWMEAGVLNRIPELQRIDERLWVVT